MTTTTNTDAESTEVSAAEPLQQGIWGEEMTQNGVRRVTFRKPLPMQLIRQYAEKAARRAVARQLEDGTWFAEIKGFQGVWADGATREEALDMLGKVVEEWVILKIRDEDRDIPVLGLDLNEL